MQGLVCSNSKQECAQDLQSRACCSSRARKNNLSQH